MQQSVLQQQSSYDWVIEVCLGFTKNKSFQRSQKHQNFKKIKRFRSSNNEQLIILKLQKVWIKLIKHPSPHKNKPYFCSGSVKCNFCTKFNVQFVNITFFTWNLFHCIYHIIFFNLAYLVVRLSQCLFHIEFVTLNFPHCIFHTTFVSDCMCHIAFCHITFVTWHLSHCTFYMVFVTLYLSHFIYFHITFLVLQLHF